MKYGFDTERDDAAVAAFLIHSVYTSRDRGRLKISMDLWSRIERFVKAAAKRAQTLAEFVERLKPRLCCETLRPLRIAPADGTGEETRDFLTGVFGRPAADPVLVLRALSKETSLCVLLVRERLEREKAERIADADADADADDFAEAA